MFAKFISQEISAALKLCGHAISSSYKWRKIIIKAPNRSAKYLRCHYRWEDMPLNAALEIIHHSLVDTDGFLCRPPQCTLETSNTGAAEDAAVNICTDQRYSNSAAPPLSPARVFSTTHHQHLLGFCSSVLATTIINFESEAICGWRMTNEFPGHGE